MTSLEFFLQVLWQVIWPPKGIIYMEEQVLQWCVAIAHSWLQQYGYTIFIILGIGMALSYAIGQSNVYPRGRTIRRMIRNIWNWIVRIAFAWLFLLYGAVRGTMTIAEETQETRRLLHRHAHRSWHYRLGRWLSRIAYRLLGHVGLIARNEQMRRIIARTIALVICLWGVWNIPYDLTH